MIVKTTNNRSLLAGILLVLFLQVIFVKSFHRHHYINNSEISCDKTSVLSKNDECVICLFSFQPYEEALEQASEILYPVFPEISIIYRDKAYNSFSSGIYLRAPPLSLTGEI
jgi:hypothetical protein